jgi:hypothetical protein
MDFKFMKTSWIQSTERRSSGRRFSDETAQFGDEALIAAAIGQFSFRVMPNMNMLPFSRWVTLNSLTQRN